MIMKYMFDLEEAKESPTFYEDLKVEVGLECERTCGPLEKVTVFAGNPDGVIALKFKSAVSAAKCIELNNKRFFGGREISCFYFDGKTNYKMQETEEDQKKRLDDFGDWLENQ